MTKIAVIGTGLMGKPMAEKLYKSGYDTIAYNRSPEKLTSLAEVGVETVTDVRQALEKSEYIILMLSDAGAIAQVLLSDNLSLLKNKIVIQMATISPQQSRELEKTMTEAGASYLEAPVLGSIPQVKSGELLVMVGGDNNLYNQSLDIFQVFGEKPLYTGDVGTASALKLALNQLIASLTASFALSLSFVQTQGADVEQFMSILRESALYAPTFDKKLQRMCDRDYKNPNFPTKHLLKDVDLFLCAADAVDLNTQGLAGIREIVTTAITQGLAEQDYSSIYNAINPV